MAEADPPPVREELSQDDSPAFLANRHSELLRHLPVVPAAPGDKPYWLTITARRVSGRRFGEVPTSL